MLVIAKHRHKTIFTDKAFWNHIGFHRRWVYVNVYSNNKEIVCYTVHDKKKKAMRNHKLAFANTHLKCYRLRIRPNHWRPNKLWTHRYPPDINVEIVE